MADRREAFIVDFKADTAAFTAKIGSATKMMAKFGSLMGRASLVGFGAATLGAAGLAAAFEKVRGNIDQLAKDAKRLRGTVGEVQALAEFAGLSGTNFEKMLPAIEKVSAAIGEAGIKGKGPVAEMLAILGTSAGELVGLKPLQQFIAISERLNALGKGSDQDAIGKLLFGAKGYSALKPAIDDISSLMGVMSRREALGINVGQADAARIESLNDEVSRITGTIGDVFQVVLGSGGGGLLELVTQFRQGMDAFLVSMGGAAGVARIVGDAVRAAAEDIQAAVALLRPVLEAVNAVANDLGDFGRYLSRSLAPMASTSEVDAAYARERGLDPRVQQEQLFTLRDINNGIRDGFKQPARFAR